MDFTWQSGSEEGKWGYTRLKGKQHLSRPEPGILVHVAWTTSVLVRLDSVDFFASVMKCTKNSSADGQPTFGYVTRLSPIKTNPAFSQSVTLLQQAGGEALLFTFFSQQVFFNHSPEVAVTQLELCYFWLWLFSSERWQRWVKKTLFFEHFYEYSLTVQNPIFLFC